MSEWACGGHGIVRCSLGREPSQRNISTHLSDMEVDRARWGSREGGKRNWGTLRHGTGKL